MRAPTVVFDGECGLCHRAAAWLRARVPTEIRVVPWQSLDLGAHGLTVGDVTNAAYWLEDGRRERGHRAVGRALVAVGGAWRLVGWLCLAPPTSAFAAVAYALVARSRHWILLPGAESCPSAHGMGASGEQPMPWDGDERSASMSEREHTRPNRGTEAAERDDAEASHAADRMPTPEEEEVAESLLPDESVAEHEREMLERGAHQRGEGRIP